MLKLFIIGNHIWLWDYFSISPAKLFVTKFKMDTEVLHTITHFTCADYERMNNTSDKIQLPFNIRVFNSWSQLNLGTRLPNMKDFFWGFYLG